MLSTVAERIEVMVPDPFSAERIDRLRSVPGFSEAVRTSFLGALAFYENDAPTANTLKDVGRFWTGMLCIHLHVTDGLTLARLRELCEKSGFISPNAAEALIGQMRDQGLIGLAAEQPNRREVRLVATERLMTSFRNRVRVEIEAGACIDARLERLARSWDRPGVFEKFFGTYVGALMMGVDTYDPSEPGMFSLFSHHAGPLMLMRISAGGEADDSFPPSRPVPLSVSAIAQAFDVSRMHVSRLIALGEAEGLMARSEDGRRLTLTPLLRDRVEHFFAIVYILAAMVFVWTQDQLDLVEPATGSNYRFRR